MNKVRIVSATASKSGATLYQEDGKVLHLKSDGFKTQQILDMTIEPLAQNKVVEIDLDEFSLEKVVESKTNGMIKFLTAGLTDLLNGLKSFEEPEQKPVIAIVGDKKIPGVEKLAKHIEQAVVNDNTIGLQRFMERIASVIDERSHTVQELLNFMSRGDLPIAEDGSIVAYKVLRSAGDHFVDCHTGNVPQKLGSRVSMPVDHVDQNRRHECSTGLHIARRGYLTHFSGNIITIVKVAPEDVVAVPPGEPDKMRAAAYHIVAVLPDRVHRILRNNQPMTSDEEASQILADVIAGNHPPVLEEVVINGPNGGDVKVTPVKSSATPAKKGSSGKKAKALDDRQSTTLKVADINKRVKKVVAETRAPKGKAADRVAEWLKTLSKEQKKILAMLDKGDSQREVERQLHVAAKTIRKLERKRQAVIEGTA